jgi:cobalt/nickel transport system permease protein
MTLALQPIAAAASPFSRYDPRWKLVALLVLAASIALLKTLPAIALGFVVSLALVCVARLPGPWYRVRVYALLISFLPFLVLIPFTVQRGATLGEWGWVRLTTGGLEVAVGLTLKSVSLLSVMLVQLGSAPFHRTLRAAGDLGCPRLLVHLGNLTYRYLFLLAQEFQRIRTALRVRGFRNRPTRRSYHTIGGVVGTLLVRSSDRAERVAQAMRCRGFDGTVRSFETFRTRWTDVLMTLLLIGAAAGLLVWDRWG